MDEDNEFFLFSGFEQKSFKDGKVIEEGDRNNAKKSKGVDRSPSEEREDYSSNVKSPIFQETHTPTVQDSDEESVHVPKSKQMNNTVSEKKANTKEVVFLDEETEDSSKSSDDSNSAISSHDGEPIEIIDIDDLLVSGGSSGEHSQTHIENENEERADAFDLDIANDYFNRQKGEITCRKCGKNGHKAAICPIASKYSPCSQCAETTHQTIDCPTNICRHCNYQGHNTKQCPTRSVSPTCNNCSSRLHRTDNCPMIPKPCDKSVFQMVHCLVCGLKGHVICKQQPALQGSTYGRCAICGSVGHSYKMCRDRFTPRTIHSGERKEMSRSGGSGCYTCGEYGHIAGNCPSRRQNAKRDHYSGGQNNRNEGSNKKQIGGYASKIRG